jgi:hypothetical protein
LAWEFQSFVLYFRACYECGSIPWSAVTRRRQGYAGRAESPLERRLRLRTPWTAFAVVIELTWTLDIPCGLSDNRLFKVAALGRLIECTGISKFVNTKTA